MVNGIVAPPLARGQVLGKGNSPSVGGGFSLFTGLPRALFYQGVSGYTCAWRAWEGSFRERRGGTGTTVGDGA
jgi:hypothetical protein